MNGVELMLAVSGVRYKVNKARIFQEINEHSRLEITLSLKGSYEAGENFESFTPVQLLMVSEEEKVIFSGLILKTVRYRKDGVFYGDMTVSSYTLLFDLERKKRSFQNESRTYGELMRLILSGYPSGAYIWNGEEKSDRVDQFLLQYQESDWEFMKRLASMHHKGLIPETTVPGPKLYIGPLKRNEKEISGGTVRLKLDFQSVRRRIENGQEDTNILPVQSGKEYRIYGADREIELGAPALYMGESLIAVETNACFINGDWQYDYVFKTQAGCEVEPLKNENLRGTSVSGTVINSRFGFVQLRLESDAEEEVVESRHIQPTYYAGAGRGYGGRPELGDTLLLYFASNTENERYIISSADAGAEKIGQMVNSGAGKKGSLPMTKCLTTAAGLGAVLDGTGIWIHSKGQATKIMVAKDTISIDSQGDIEIGAENIKGAANEVSLTAKDFIWMHSGDKGMLLTEDQLQMKDSEIKIFSPLNETCEIPDQDAVNAVLAAFEEKRKNGAEFFEADGSLHRIGGTETENGKNVQMVMDAIQELDDFRKHVSDYNLSTDEYHTYTQSEITYNKKRDATIVNAMAFWPNIGSYLSTLGQAALDSDYENGPEGTLISAFFNFGPGAAGKVAKTWKTAFDSLGYLSSAYFTSSAIVSNPSGNHANQYVDQYSPYGGSQIFYGEDKYFINAGDVYIKIGVKNHEGEYVGVVEGYLSKEEPGDPMEIQVLWYYGKAL